MRIAINGAGVAGPALAFWLRRGGHEPVLIEKSPRFRTGGYLIDFWGVGYVIAERMGILPQVRQAGYSVREVRFVDRVGRRAGGFTLDVLRNRLDDRFTSLPRGDLAEAIYSALGDEVETRFDDSIVALREDPDGVSVTLASGTEDRFDLVVGADGLHSKVRELAFGPQDAFEVQLGYQVAAFEVDGYRPRDELAYVSYAEPGRTVSRFALRGDRTIFLFVFRSGGEADPHDALGRKQRLRSAFSGMGWECAQMLQAMDQVDDIYLDRVSQIRMPTWSKGRVALIGDAAACVSLLAGEGTGLAMTEAYVLAGELARAGGDHLTAFHGYETRLRGLIETKQKSAKDFAASFAPKTRLGIVLRNAVASLIDFRPVADLFIGSSLHDDLDLPDYRL